MPTFYNPFAPPDPDSLPEKPRNRPSAEQIREIAQRAAKTMQDEIHAVLDAGLVAGDVPQMVRLLQEMYATWPDPILIQALIQLLSMLTEYWVNMQVLMDLGVHIGDMRSAGPDARAAMQAAGIDPDTAQGLHMHVAIPADLVAYAHALRQARMSVAEFLEFHYTPQMDDQINEVTGEDMDPLRNDSRWLAVLQGITDKDEHIVNGVFSDLMRRNGSGMAMPPELIKHIIQPMTRLFGMALGQLTPTDLAGSRIAWVPNEATGLPMPILRPEAPGTTARADVVADGDVDALDYGLDVAQNMAEAADHVITELGLEPTEE
jgi:hypothetical protein